MTTDSDQPGTYIIHEERNSFSRPAHPACAAWLAAHPEWAPLPGARNYEASHRGNGVRSLDRTVNGRQLRGKVLSATPGGSGGYPKVKITRDDGTVVTGYVHGFVLAAHAGPPPDGQETLHGKGGPLDSRYCGCPADECAEGNLRYGTRWENEEDKYLNGLPRAAPKPDKHCVRCDAVFTGNGKRCHPCVVEIGVEAAALLRSGVTLGAAAEQLRYPSVDGLHTLAVKYGGYGVEHPRWTHRVAATLRRLRRSGDRP